MRKGQLRQRLVVVDGVDLPHLEKGLLLVLLLTGLDQLAVATQIVFDGLYFLLFLQKALPQLTHRRVLERNVEFEELLHRAVPLEPQVPELLGEVAHGPLEGVGQKLELTGDILRCFPGAVVVNSRIPGRLRVNSRRAVLISKGIESEVIMNRQLEIQTLSGLGLVTALGKRADVKGLVPVPSGELECGSGLVGLLRLEFEAVVA